MTGPARKKPRKGYLSGHFVNVAALPDAKARVTRIRGVQTSLKKYGYEGEPDGDWGPRTEAAFRKFLHDFVQDSPEYKKFIAAGARTANGNLLEKDGLYGEFSQKVLDAMAKDGRLDKTLVETIRLLKGGGKMVAAVPRVPALTVTSVPAASGGFIFWGDSIARGLGAQFRGATNLGIDGAGIGSDVKPVADLKAEVLPKCRGKVVTISEGTNVIFSLDTDEKIREHARLLAARAADIRDAGGAPLVLDERRVTGVYLGGDRKLWKLDAPRAEQAKIVAEWNRRADKLNKALLEEMTTRGLANNFLLTQGKVKIGADNLHPEFSRAGFGALAQLISERTPTLFSAAP